MSDLDDLIATANRRDADFANLPDFDFGSLFNTGNDLTLPWGGSTFEADTFTLPPPETIGGGGGFGDLLRNAAGFLQTIYQGEAAVERQKLLDKIALARLGNQLETVKTTPNVWLVLALGAGAVLFLSDRRDGRRNR